MGQVTVMVNDRSYTVGCDDGEEAHVTYLAEYIDRRVRELAQSVGQVGEARLLLLASLLIADDLSNAFDELDRNRAGPEEQDAAHLATLADRLEAVAHRLETA